MRSDKQLPCGGRIARAQPRKRTKIYMDENICGAANISDELLFYLCIALQKEFTLKRENGDPPYAM